MNSLNTASHQCDRMAAGVKVENLGRVSVPHTHYKAAIKYSCKIMLSPWIILPAICLQCIPLKLRFTELGKNIT
jgi:hypothetical protein